MRHRTQWVCAWILGSTALTSSSDAVALGERFELTARQRQALEVVAVAEALADQVQDRIWPNYRFREIPIALFEPGGAALLVHADDAPSGFTRQFVEALDLEVAVGPTTEAMNANTAGLLGGRVTALVSMDSLAPGPDVRASQLVLLIHETGHAFQARAPDGGVGRWPVENAMMVAQYPVELAENNAWGQIEGAVLRQALLETDDEASSDAVGDFLAIREQRRRTLAPELVTFEEHAELNEGLAEYFGRCAVVAAASSDLCSAFPELDPGEYGQSGSNFAELLDRLEQINVLGEGASRQRSYWTGAAQAFLLDRLASGWKGRLEAERGTTLTRLLTELAPLDEAQRASRVARVADRYGYSHRLERERSLAGALAARRLRQLDEAWGAPGRRLILDLGAAGGANDLRSFDPLNIVTLADGIRLHRRFLELGFQGGQAKFERAVLQDLGDGLLVSTLEGPLEHDSIGSKVRWIASGVELHFATDLDPLEDEEFVLFAPGCDATDIEPEPWWARIESAREAMKQALPAPHWSCTDLAGHAQSSDSDPPLDTWLFFFSAAQWAVPSQTAYRELTEALSDLPRASERARVFLVATQCTAQALEAFLPEGTLRDHLLHDPDRFLQRAFGISNLPAWVQVNTEGRIVTQSTGRGAVAVETIAEQLLSRDEGN